MKTGYFGRASEKGQSAKHTKVHVVDGDKAICGYKPYKTMLFQWCSYNIYYEFIGCKSVKQKLEFC